MQNMSNFRKTEYHVDSIFLNRWSPRALSGEEISEKRLMSLFEAARWAPSSYNNQPWRYIYALKGTKHWDPLYNLMNDFNKSWAKNASALVVILSKKTFDHNSSPSITHSFDAGASWENLALQGSIDGLVVHAMQGFDYEKARTVLGVPDEYEVLAMAAIGLPGKKQELSKELQDREIPSGRKKISEIVSEGKFMLHKP